MELYRDLSRSRFLFRDTRMAWVWLLVRVYLGYQWLMAGWAKVMNPDWVGADSGVALTKFLNASLLKAGGTHPDVSAWYAWLIQHVALPHTALFSHAVAFGETAVGVALILGLYTGGAALLGGFMNFNFLLAGSVSVNPVMLIAEIALALAWRVAGWYGLDRYLLKRR